MDKRSNLAQSCPIGFYSWLGWLPLSISNAFFQVVGVPNCDFHRTSLTWENVFTTCLTPGLLKIRKIIEQSYLKQDHKQRDIPEKLFKLSTVSLKRFKRLVFFYPSPLTPKYLSKPQIPTAGEIVLR